MLKELDGWDEKALSEDTELSFRVYESGYHIRFFPEGVTWEQEPETLKVWWKQRTRWARGNLYVIGKYLFRVTELKSKRVMLDLLYFISIYLLFFAGILLSHSLFVTSFVVDLNLTIGSVSFLLIFIGFLVFVTQVCLALSLEQNQLTSKNVMTVALMYIIYSQMWIFLVIYASGLEIKRVMFKQEARWYKTERFNSKSKGQKEID
ncbi:dolichol-phosphate mannosyltransferase [Geomicrobium sp. JCM 19038]|nr:dolichol-phosphate mannosyltransferase [Geomicrobium sp. JCM 19038]